MIVDVVCAPVIAVAVGVFIATTAAHSGSMVVTGIVAVMLAAVMLPLHCPPLLLHFWQAAAAAAAATAAAMLPLACRQ